MKPTLFLNVLWKALKLICRGEGAWRRAASRARWVNIHINHINRVLVFLKPFWGNLFFFFGLDVLWKLHIAAAVSKSISRWNASQSLSFSDGRSLHTKVLPGSRQLRCGIISCQSWYDYFWMCHSIQSEWWRFLSLLLSLLYQIRTAVICVRTFIC